MRMRFAAGLAALIAISGACGGRFVDTGPDRTSAGTSNASGTPALGASNTGATAPIGTAGASAGGILGIGGILGVGGSISSAGTGFGFGGTSPLPCACGLIDCPPFSEPVPDPDGCCFHCESFCNAMACGAIACPSGYHVETVPGECCPACLVNVDCKRELVQYQDFKKQILDKTSSIGCMTASDCTVYYEKNQCQIASCGVVIPTAGVGFVDGSLQMYAQQGCAGNCPISVTPCDAPAVMPRCLNGRCQ